MNSEIKKTNRLGFELGGFLCLLLGLVLIFPLIYAFLTSFMPAAEMLNYPPPLIPESFTNLSNYKEVFTRFPVFRYMFNSALIGVIASCMRIITSMTAAFSFSFFNYKGKNLLFFLALATMMIPGDVTIVANYATTARLKLTDTYLGLMIVYFVSANNMFIMRQSMLSIPKELREAAYIDGCSNTRFFTDIVVPCSKGIIVAVFISSFVGLWNAYFWPLLVTNSDNMRTVQLGLQRLHTEDEIAYGPAMAGTCFILIPSIIVFAVFQRKIVRGITAGAVKG